MGFGEGSEVEKGRGGGEFPNGCWGWRGFGDISNFDFSFGEVWLQPNP